MGVMFAFQRTGGGGRGGVWEMQLSNPAQWNFSSRSCAQLLKNMLSPRSLPTTYCFLGKTVIYATCVPSSSLSNASLLSERF